MSAERMIQAAIARADLWVCAARSVVLWCAITAAVVILAVKRRM